MLLSDVGVGTKIAIKAVQGDKALVFDSEIIDQYNGDTTIAPVYDGKALVNFESKNVSLSVIATVNDTEFTFSNVAIVRGYDVDNSPLYNIKNNNIAGTYENRRGALRFSVKEECTFMVVGKEDSGYGELSDVSVTGFCLETTKQLEVGNWLIITFTDSRTHKCINVNAIIRRKVDKGINNLIRYGCELQYDNRLMSQYIMAVQREKIAVKTKKVY